MEGNGVALDPDDGHDIDVVAVDVGGTFTDVLRLRDGRIDTMKVLSSPPNFEDAIIRGLEALAEPDPESRSDFGAFLHGTTVATNALLEARGATTALVTTRGFRDVLELSRNRNTSGLDITWRKQDPLVPRRLRFEVDERVASDGSVIHAIDEREIGCLAGHLEAIEVRAVAVCFLNAYVNSAHECRVVELLRERLPGIFVTGSHELIPEMREYERTSTTVANAYVGPVMSDYVASLDAKLRMMSPSTSFRVMQSNGGLTNALRARSQPVRLIESGPAGGATAAALLAGVLDERRVLAFDMGGTTAKISLIEDFAVAEVSEFTVGAGMNASRLRRGDGHPILIPSVDIVEVGAGGGSVCWTDAVGQPHVGPQSAGADPGPICYGRGGTQVTVTDANAVLGYLNPSEIAGGTQRLDVDKAREAIERQVAQPLGLSTFEAAYGIVRLVNANMARAVRAASVERGRDPRGYTMIAFGGAGPMHAGAVADHFGMSTVVVPPVPGVFSALGLLLAETRIDLVRKLPDANAQKWPSIAEALIDLEREARSDLESEGVAEADQRVSLFVDLAYRGQTLVITVPVASSQSISDQETFQDATHAFEKAYTQVFGHAGIAAEITAVNVRVRGLGPATGTDVGVFRAAAVSQGTSSGGRSASVRKAYFGPGWGVVDTPVLQRSGVPDGRTEGPMIVEGDDSTVVVPPEHDVEISGETGCLIIRAASGATPTDKNRGS